MPKFVNAYAGTLIMPDKTKVEPGESVDVDKETLENKAVKEWVNDKWLVTEAAAKKAAADAADGE